jgi:SAM-dependent methyltransferase
MNALEATGPNAAQITHWNGAMGETWVRLQEHLDDQFVPLTETAIDRAAVREGERILDVGCGTGKTTLELAERVGTGGKVLGLDISGPMLELARRRLASTGLAQASFEQVDAQTHAFSPSSFDLVFSRFGVMFFADPVAAFGNLRSALRKGGRLTFMCWRAPNENPWIAIPMAAAFQHIPRPPAPPPGAPGEFAFADGERVRAILSEAGFADVRVDPVDGTIGRSSLDDAVFMTLNMGPVAAVLRDTGGDKREIVAEAVRGALAPHMRPEGLHLPAAVWIAQARNP